MSLDTLKAIVLNDLPWEPFQGMRGLSVVVLSNDLDEAAGTGSRTRLVRFDSGARTHDILQHPYWEEVLCLSGSLGGADGSQGKDLSFVRRPPGTPHGPFASPEGCILAEFQYFTPRR